MNETDHLYMPKDHMEELYTSGDPLVRFIHNDRLNQIVENMPSKEGLKILDAGCGEGHLIERLYNRNKGNSYYGIDIIDVALKKSKERCPFAKIEKMSVSDIRYNEEFFDVIICTEVIEHIYDYKKVILEFKRLLKKGGYLIITFPNENLWTVSRFFLGRRPVKVPDHVNSFNPNFMQRLIGMNLLFSRNLPFRLPFFMSLGCLMGFKK